MSDTPRADAARAIFEMNKEAGVKAYEILVDTMEHELIAASYLSCRKRGRLYTNMNKLESKQEELWIAIPGFNGYEASSFGRIRYIKRWKIPKILKAGKHSRGYDKYTLYVDGESFTVTGHRMVALAFIPNPSLLPEVNHINAIKNDNRPINLEWVNSEENRNHAIKNGLYKSGEKHPNAKLSNSDVVYIKSLLLKSIKPSIIARQFGVTKSLIKKIRSKHQRINA